MEARLAERNDRLNVLRNTAAALLAGALIGVIGALFLNALWIADVARVALAGAAVKHSGLEIVLAASGKRQQLAAQTHE